jgi:hypothetical protein
MLREAANENKISRAGQYGLGRRRRSVAGFCVTGRLQMGGLLMSHCQAQAIAWHDFFPVVTAHRFSMA